MLVGFAFPGDFNRGTDFNRYSLPRLKAVLVHINHQCREPCMLFTELLSNFHADT